MTPLDKTHDPAATSWVTSANREDTDFPLQNLPYGVFRTAGGEARPGVAIGDQILDLAACREAGLLGDLAAADACAAPTLNGLMAVAADDRRRLRHRLFDLLAASGGESPAVRGALVPQAAATLELPARVGDYTDFYASVFHATNVGSMFRPNNPLLPNYKHIPIGYHGRASSIVASGTPVKRPQGQTKADDADGPTFGPCRLLDYELEVGIFIGPGNALGETVSIADASDHLFGFCLVNDWSARDLQKWEYQPLGPFLAKSFATTLSPWVVTTDALAPFRAAAFERPEGDPQPLPYLDDEDDRKAGGLDLRLEVQLVTPAMREQNLEPHSVSRGSFLYMYWTPAQMLTHHASNGCNVQPGDLLASGTVSGPEPSSRGCLLELTWRGAEPVELPSGEQRRFLQDGDEVILRGHCERDGFRRIGFGECRGRIEPAG